MLKGNGVYAAEIVRSSGRSNDQEVELDLAELFQATASARHSLSEDWYYFRSGIEY